MFDVPVTVFSGLSPETRDIVMAQNPVPGARINVERALSTSVNPAQVNGFMRGESFISGSKVVSDKNVALVIETNNGKDKNGRTADIVITLRRIDDNLL